MKKIITFILSIVMLALSLPTLFACGKEQVLIYSSGEEDRIAFVQEKLNEKFPQYDIIIQYQATGDLVSKLQGEGTDTDCDIIHELEINNMETLLAQNENFFYSLEDYNFTKFNDFVVSSYIGTHKKYAPSCMTYCTIIYNKKTLQDAGLAIPTTYADLCKSCYKNKISMPNPKISGTGYAFYNGLVSLMGKPDALSYFNSLNSNIKEYTNSGSTPIKNVNTGANGIAIGFAMLWQCIQYCSKNSDLAWTTLGEASPYNLYNMAIINGHEQRQCVKEVFDYIYNELNLIDIEHFISDPVYKVSTPENPAYQTALASVSPITMLGVGDSAYKTNLLDSWSFS